MNENEPRGVQEIACASAFEAGAERAARERTQAKKVAALNQRGMLTLRMENSAQGGDETRSEYRGKALRASPLESHEATRDPLAVRLELERVDPGREHAARLVATVPHEFLRR